MLRPVFFRSEGQKTHGHYYDTYHRRGYGGGILPAGQFCSGMAAIQHALHDIFLYRISCPVQTVFQHFYFQAALYIFYSTGICLHD